MSEHEPRVFNRLTIHLHELADDVGDISNVLVQNCEIRGPAVIAWENGTPLLNCTWTGDGDSILWPVSRDRPAVTGAFSIHNCAFQDSTFFMIGIAVHEDDMPIYRQAFGMP